MEDIILNEQTAREGEGQGGLACCSPWGHESRTRLSDRTTPSLMKRKNKALPSDEEEQRLPKSWARDV